MAISKLSMTIILKIVQSKKKKTAKLTATSPKFEASNPPRINV